MSQARPPADDAGYSALDGLAAEPALGALHALQVLYRRRRIAISAFLLVFLAIAVYTVSTVRIYEATARLLIERQTPKVVSFQEVLEQSTVTDDYYETQYAILRGRGLARRTVDTLGLWSHPLFAAPSGMTIRGVLGAPFAIAERWLHGRARAASPEVAETAEQSRVIDRFLDGLEVRAIRFSRLVDVAFRSPDPALSAKIVNALATAYVEQDVEFRTRTTREASDFLTQQLSEQREKLEASEQALQAYREQTDSVSLEERQNVVVQRLADLNAAVTKASAVRIQKEAAYNQVAAVQGDPSAIDKAPIVLSNTFVQQQKTELAQLERQRAQVSERLGANHPDMVKIGLAIENAESRIRAEVARIVLAMRSDYEAAVAEERSLTVALERQKQEAQALNRAGIQYGVLQRDATANRQMFEGLLQRTQETGVSEQLKAGNIRIIDAAETPSAPVSPNTLNNLLIALLGGAALAVGLAFGVEYSDDRIKTPDELTRHLGLPFLGMVPALFDHVSPDPLISDGVPGAFAESFRSVRTNVLFSSADEGSRAVVVTSSSPGEGKTIVSTNLAVALARTGHRVLLIDADMRKPRVHDVFSCPSAPGLSNFLVGNAVASKSLRPSSVEGLWLMPAGTTPPNPAELLGSKRFQDFLTFLQEHFDWIIVDTPPVMAVTDAAIAANRAHGVLFVVGAEMTSRRLAQRAVDQLEMARARFVGAVLNRVDLEHHPYYYSSYYRSEYGSYYGATDAGVAAADGAGLGLATAGAASTSAATGTLAADEVPFARPR